MSTTAPDSSRSSSSNSMGSPPTQTTESEDVAPAPEQEHPPERRFSQTLIEELSSQLPAPTPVHLIPHEASASAAEPSASHSPRPASPPVSLPQALREIAALSSLPSHALPLLEMGFSRRHVIQAMMVTGTRETADAHRINMLVTWLLEHPVSDDGVSQYFYYNSRYLRDEMVHFNGYLMQCEGSRNCKICKKSKECNF